MIVFKTVIERASKYFLVKGLVLDISLKGKIVALHNEIMITIETPHESGGKPAPKFVNFICTQHQILGILYVPNTKF